MHTKSIVFYLAFLLQLSNHTVGYNQRYDFNWILGYAGNRGDLRFGTTLMDFNKGNPIVSFIPQGSMFMYSANASISDEHGILQYYSNGYDVEDNNYKKVKGATNLGAKYWDALIANQGVLFLPKPGNSVSNYLFYVNLLENSGHYYIEDLKYLVIDNIRNTIMEKGTVIHDTLNEGFLSACKHANGRDWWILLNKQNTNVFYKFILTPNTITKIDSQVLGPIINEGFGQVIFSPNGEFFADYENISDVDGAYINLYKFDRCNGQIHFLKSSHIDSKLFGGISFSPNSRFLYQCAGFYLNQYDLLESTNLDNAVEIAVITEQFPPFGSSYSLQQSAPDGRIYISNATSNNIFHVINKPNEKGKASQPKFNSFFLKTLNQSIPNNPEFRLGPIDGSICDSLGIDNIPWCWWRYDQDTIDHLNFEFTDLSAYEVEEWYWDFGDGTSSITKDNIHHYTKNGIYNVCLIVKNKNGSDTLCRTLNVGMTDTKTLDQHLNLKLFPNPCADFFYVNVLDYNPEKMILKLIDTQGKFILEQRLYNGTNYIELGDLPSSVYAVQIFEKGILFESRKLVKY